jgi:hypothetical protein
MADYQIDCINKPDRLSPHEHITHVGGPNPDGTGRWKEPFRMSSSSSRTSSIGSTPKRAMHPLGLVLEPALRAISFCRPMLTVFGKIICWRCRNAANSENANARALRLVYG